MTQTFVESCAGFEVFQFSTLGSEIAISALTLQVIGPAESRAVVRAMASATMHIHVHYLLLKLCASFIHIFNIIVESA